MFQNNPNFKMAYCSVDGSIRTALEQRNINFIPMKKLCVKEVRRVLKEYSPDAIHAHDIRASVLAAFCAPKSIKIISHVHGKFNDMKKVTAKAVLYCIASRQFEKIICVSNSIVDEYIFQKNIKNKCIVLYNVVNDKALIQKAKLDNNLYDYDIVFIGRLCDVKNPKRLYRVLKMCIETKPDIKAAIIGTGEYEAFLKNSIQNDGLDNNIKLLGFMSNPLKVVESSKSMIMTSKTEGTPMCALEAMAFGVPIVSTPTDGLMELVDDGVTGYLSDDDKTLSHALCSICSDNNLRENLSFKTRKKFKEVNDLENYKKVILSIYEAVERGTIKK